MLSQFTKEELQKLASAQSAEELQEIVNKGNSGTLTTEKSAELFAALGPHSRQGAAERGRLGTGFRRVCA